MCLYSQKKRKLIHYSQRINCNPKTLKSQKLKLTEIKLDKKVKIVRSNKGDSH